MLSAGCGLASPPSLIIHARDHSCSMAKVWVGALAPRATAMVMASTRVRKQANAKARPYLYSGSKAKLKAKTSIRPWIVGSF